MKTGTLLLLCCSVISLAKMEPYEKQQERKKDKGTLSFSYPAGPEDSWATNAGLKADDSNGSPKKVDRETERDGRSDQRQREKHNKVDQKEDGKVDEKKIQRIMLIDIRDIFQRFFEWFASKNVNKKAENVTRDTDLLEIEIVPVPDVSHRCKSYNTQWPNCAGLTKDHKKSLGEALTEFGLRLYQEISFHSEAGNIVFSPISIATVLSQLLLGARGDTKVHLEEALSYSNDFTCVHEALKAFSTSSSMISASQIFLQQDLQLHDFFLKQSEDFYGVTPMMLTNDSSTNVEKVNKWIADHTQGKITELVDDISPDVRLILLNAIYFQSKWKTVFKKSKTVNEVFLKNGRQQIEVPTMKSEKYELAYITDHSLRAKVGRFRLFKNTSLIIILPQGPSQRLSEVEGKLSPQVFRAMLQKLKQTSFKQTMVSLPKFKVDFSQNLMEILEKLGLSELFSSPNLCGMSNQEDLLVTDARHRAVLELNEEGVEAAAATSVSLSRAAWVFEVNQPFVMVVWDDQLGYPLFMGRVHDPSQGTSSISVVG